MSYTRSTHTTARRTVGIFAVVLLVVAALATALGERLSAVASSSSTVASPTDIPRTEQPPRQAEDEAASPIDDSGSQQHQPQLPPQQAVAPIDIPRREHRTRLGAADGAVPDGATAFDDELPAIANLDPALLNALRQVASAAVDDGIELRVTSGWRSPAYQNQLLREAVAEYGSETEAARWVATADTSPHVSGDAVDIGPATAMAWLSEHGAEYGLCQIYRNEPWHYELRPAAIDRGCPAMYADPTHDPRMQR